MHLEHEMGMLLHAWIDHLLLLWLFSSSKESKNSRFKF